MLPYSWRLSINVARVALGIGALALDVLWGRSPFSWWSLPLLAFVAYALYALRLGMETAGNPGAWIAVDTAAFAAWVALASRAGYPRTAWVVLALAVFLFLLCGGIIAQPWRPVAAAVACAAASVMAAPAPERAALALPMACAVLVAAAWVLNRDHIDARLFRASQHSVRYRFEAQQAREEERQRIAADFHDGPLQSFIGLQMRLEIVKKLLGRDPHMAFDELSQIQELCRSQVAELRAFVRSMRPADVTGSSLGASISRMVEQFQKDTGISASFMSAEYVEPAQTELSIELLQVVREALNNVQKHAGASRVDIALAKAGAALEISVDDNGGGFPFSGAYSLDELDQLRLGPVSIRRRVRAMRGELNVESWPGRGAALRVRVALS